MDLVLLLLTVLSADALPSSTRKSSWSNVDIGSGYSNAGSNSHDQSRIQNIVNGKDSEISQEPYQLQMYLANRFRCGASIISKQWAITAAHCLYQKQATQLEPRKLTLLSGSTYRGSGSPHRVVKIRVHKLYDPRKVDYDIGLLKVQEPFINGPNVQAVALPVQGEWVKEGEVGVVSGWGRIAEDARSSEILQRLEVPVVNRMQCFTNYYNEVTTFISLRQLCAAGINFKQDACKGDSGGPFVVNGKLIGIVSFGKGCARPKFPGVYTRVSKFRNWIRKQSGV